MIGRRSAAGYRLWRAVGQVELEITRPVQPPHVSEHKQKAWYAQSMALLTAGEQHNHDILLALYSPEHFSFHQDQLLTLRRGLLRLRLEHSGIRLELLRRRIVTTCFEAASWDCIKSASTPGARVWCIHYFEYPPEDYQLNIGGADKVP